MQRYIQHILKGIQSNLIGLPLLLVYNVLPLVGLLWLGWDPYAIAWIYWFEALLLLIYETALAVKLGPAGGGLGAEAEAQTSDATKKNRANFLLTSFLFIGFLLMYQWMTYQFIADTILGYNAGEIGSSARWEVLMEFIPVVGIQVVLVAVYYVMQFVRTIQKPDEAVRTTSLLRRWFTTAFIPLMMGLLIAQLGDGVAFIVVLVVVVFLKICVDLWYQGGELQQEKGVDEFDLRKHPFAVFSIVQSAVLVAIAMFALLIVFPGRWDPTVSSTGNLIGFSAILLFLMYFAVPAKVRVWFDREAEELHIYKRKVRTMNHVIPIQDIRRISRKKGENGQPGPWEVHVVGKTSIRLPVLYLSQIEMHHLFEYIQEQYSEIRTVMPKKAPDHHA